ncbi:MAG: chromosome segregation protein SMC [Planctomycetes bacterium]|nr:chromosome segregation protein SMC [Planctomycetota bacterium]MBI3836256.1 chromosome segregation protein SMC [Planctomycetota bacterium]
MFLKRVTMCGFKSFCDKVDFDFGPGVTCIVGPNGCGKSNVVDAVKWVLGEQSARSLRGRQMADMIFNGSAARRSSGMAQVDLSFDNSDHTLPVEHAEVTVTRKLYRSGESEYLVNGNVARLKDIRELFLDTGVGVDAYSVIEQGRVDQLLQSNPADRRTIFEEAAGISKYKARKREAERKLERTQQNLQRVADIVEELERRLRSVKLQAGKARSYQEYQALLNELRSTYAMAEYHRFTEEIAETTRKVDQCTDRVVGLRTQIDRDETAETQLALRSDSLNQQISQTDGELMRCKSALATQQERIAAAKRRIDEQTAVYARAQERLVADQERLDHSQHELDEVQRSVEELQQQTHALHAKIDTLNEKDRSLARDLTQAQAVLEDEKAGIIDLLRRSAQTHNEIIRLNTHRESLIGQKGRLSVRDAQVRSELESTLETRAQFQHRLREVEELITAESRKLDEKKQEAGRVNGVRQRLVEDLAACKERRSAMVSRRELLDDLQKKMEGVGAGVRAVLEDNRRESESKALKGVVGLVADLFETDVDHAAVIEAAIGAWDQYVVVKECGSLLDAERFFKALPGRLTTVCEDRLPPIVNAPSEVTKHEGFLGRALDFVRFPAEYERLARHLLGHTLVVDSLETALSLAKFDADGHRFVTMRGEVVEADGRVSVGPAASEAGLISRRTELTAIDSSLTEVDERIRTLTDQVNRTDAEAAHLDMVQQELRSAIYESNTAKVEANAALQSIAETVERLTNEQPLIAGEVTFLEQQINDVLEKSAEGGRSLEALENENKEREHRVSAHQDRIDALVTERRTLQEEMTTAKVAAGQLTEKRSAAAETITGLRRAIHTLETSLAAAKSDTEQCAARVADARAAIESGEEQVTELSASIEKLETHGAQLRNERDQIRMELDSLAHAIRAARGELTTVEAEHHELQMKATQLTVRRDELISRIASELNINLTETYEKYTHAEQDWVAVETEIAELRGKIDRLGNVNLDAINELKEIEDRHGFLTAQRTDLDNAIRQLTTLIEQLNAESQDRFRQAFEQIRDNFRALFRKLFGGGRADIVLEQPENILESGIEIVAQPPGKELQAISLMSGGEKSMTAIALLMSIFRTRPAPFAILDEVDAALDEANNQRFNQIVRDFVTEAQFIVITHSKRTMSIGDRLYGITMQEPGVSTRVGVQFEEASAA